MNPKPERLDHAEQDRLVDELRPTSEPLAADERAAVRAVFRLLADGREVTRQTIAEEVGWNGARARRFLDELPQTERDEQGRLVGFGGLTSSRTPHRMDLGVGVRYAWCAWDTLFLPVVLQTAAEVTSTCPDTGREINLTVTPTGIVERRPETTVLSLLRPDDDARADVRNNCCPLMHFFVDHEAAADWTANVPGAFVLDLDDAFELGRRCVADHYGPITGSSGSP